MNLVERFETLADPARLAVLRVLADPIQSRRSRDDGICACDLEAVPGLTRPAIGHPTKRLVEAGSVTAERRGRWVHHDPAAPAFDALIDALRELRAEAPGEGESA